MTPQQSEVRRMTAEELLVKATPRPWKCWRHEATGNLFLMSGDGGVALVSKLCDTPDKEEK